MGMGMGVVCQACQVPTTCRSHPPWREMLTVTWPRLPDVGVGSSPAHRTMPLPALPRRVWLQQCSSTYSESQRLPCACPSGHCLDNWPPWKPRNVLKTLHPSQERVPRGAQRYEAYYSVARCI